MKSWIPGRNLNPSTTVNNHCGIHGGEFRTSADDRNKDTWPLTSVTVQDMYFRVTNAPGVGKSWRLELYDGAIATGVYSTIADANTTGTPFDSSTYTFTAGDQVTVRFAPSGTPAAAGVVSWHFTVNGGTQQCAVIGHSGNIDSTTVDRDCGIQGSGSTDSVPTVMPCPGTFKNLYVRGIDPGAGNTRSYTLTVNGTPSALTVPLTAGNSTGNDTVNTVTVAKGDTVAMLSDVTGGTPTAGRWGWGMEFVPDTDGEFPFMGYQNGNLGATPFYYGIGEDNGSATETDKSYYMPACTLKKLYGLLSAAPSAGDTRALASRINGAPGALLASFGATDTTSEDTDSEVVTLGQLFDFEWSSTGTPTAAVGKWAVVIIDTPAPPVSSGISSMALMGVGT